MKQAIANILQHSGFKKYFFNTGWLVLEKLLSMFLGLFVGLWVARYLGPENFGKFGYVMAFSSLLSPIRKLGLDGILSREFAKSDCNTDELVVTGLFLKICGSIIVAILVPVYMYLNKEDPVYYYLASIICVSLLFYSFETLEFFFRAKVQGKTIAIAKCLGLIFAAILNIFFILGKYDLVVFGFSKVGESFLFASLLFLFYSLSDKKIQIRLVNFTRAKELLCESWPMFFGGFFALIYLYIDQVMLEEMLGSYQLGQYSAAVKISSLWYFFPLAIGWSVQTAIVNAKERSENQYLSRLQILFTLNSLMAYCLILLITLYSESIIAFLYGSAYKEAGPVLAIHIFASLFVFVGNPRGLWVMSESCFKFAFFSTFSAGFMNIFLNLLWIPVYGIKGAAWATLVSYAFTYVFSGLFFKPARKIVIMQLKSIFFIDLFFQIGKLKRMKNA